MGNGGVGRGGRQLPFCRCVHFLWQRFVRTEQLYPVFLQHRKGVTCVRAFTEDRLREEKELVAGAGTLRNSVRGGRAQASEVRLLAPSL